MSFDFYLTQPKHKTIIKWLLFVGTKGIILYAFFQGRIDRSMAKLGRPTILPKSYLIKCRVDQSTRKILNDCCNISGKNKSEIIREGIYMMYSDLTKTNKLQ